MGAKYPDNQQKLNLNIRIENGVFQVPFNLLRNSRVLMEMFNLIENNESDIVEWPNIINFDELQLLLKCWTDPSIHSSLELKSIVKMVRIADYLDDMVLMESVALNAIVPLIQSADSAEIRSKFSMEPIHIEYDDNDWDFDPIDELDERNYLMGIMPAKIVLAMFNSLHSFNKMSCFAHSFGTKHRYYTVLMSAFNDRLRLQCNKK